MSKGPRRTVPLTFDELTRLEALSRATGVSRDDLARSAFMLGLSEMEEARRAQGGPLSEIIGAAVDGLDAWGKLREAARLLRGGEAGRQVAADARDRTGIIVRRRG